MDTPHPRRLLAGVLLLVLAGLVIVPAAVGKTPPTMTNFTEVGADLDEPGPDQGTAQVSGVCDPSGISSFSFLTTGLVSDPRDPNGIAPGTYT
jgi:hypothetical protein